MHRSTDELDDDEQEYLSHGHPALYHAAALGAEMGEEGQGWYDDSDDHLILDGEDSPADEAPAAESAAVEPKIDRKESTASYYGSLCSPEQVSQLVPAGAGGLIWHAQIVADAYTSTKICRADGTIKPRRPLPHARASDFFSSLTWTADGRCCFTGVLNGWPGLTNLELVSITAKARSRLGRTYIKRLWNSGDKAAPAFPANSKLTGVRVTLRAPPWSAVGFAAGVPGFAFWYDPRAELLAYGTNMLDALSASLKGAPPPRMARAHLLAHRYAKEHESAKDKLVWHCAVVIEWVGREHVTLVELAWWGGLGGYGGKSNWYADKDARRPALYSAMPPALKAPWRSNLSEIRIFDLAARDLREFKEFLTAHTGPTKRFFEPTIAASADVRLSYASAADLMRYCLNYVRNDTHYSEQARNCQTFAADLFALLTGQHSAEPFSAVNRIMYKRHLDWFLCDPPDSAAAAPPA